MTKVSLVVALIIAATSASAQNTVETLRPALLDGIVLQLADGKPVAAAAVELSSGTGNTTRRFTTAADAEGRFVFREIPPGTYRLAAAATGYVRAEYAQRGPNGRGLPITLAAGQEFRNASVSLIGAGAISGRIHDGAGRPMANVQVQALKYVHQNGRKVMETARATITDDLGEYRLYWLPPQEYLVSAMPLRGEIRDAFISASGANSSVSNVLRLPIGPPIPLPDTEVTQPFFFPSVSDLKAASPITIRSRDDVRGIDITIRGLKSFSVQGTVTSASPSTAPLQARVRLMPRGSAFAGVSSGRGPVAPTTGEFQISGILPGEYFLVAEAGGSLAMVPLDVFADVENVKVALIPALDLPLDVTREGSVAGNEPSELAKLRILVTIFGGAAGEQMTPELQQPSGTILLRGVPSTDVRLHLMQLPENTYVKSIRMGPIDVLEHGLSLSRAPASPVEIVLSSKGGRLTGTAVNGRMELLSNVTVVLVPNAPRRQRMDLYKQAVTDMNGQFRLVGIAPGDYKVFSWEDVPSGAWLDSDFIKIYENRGSVIHLDEGGDAALQVQAIPVNR